jgi:hypothetical protein
MKKKIDLCRERRKAMAVTIGGTAGFFLSLWSSAWLWDLPARFTIPSMITVGFACAIFGSIAYTGAKYLMETDR